MKISATKWVLTALVFLSVFQDTFSQCVMCRSAIEGDKDAAEGFNSGIIYLMIIPYVFLAGTLYYVIKQRKRRKAEGNE
jgi:hypothetical protein